MTNDPIVNYICAVIVGVPMFYVAWRILNLGKEIENEYSKRK
jgi:hypothetical protein